MLYHIKTLCFTRLRDQANKHFKGQELALTPFCNGNRVDVFNNINIILL